MAQAPAAILVHGLGDTQVLFRRLQSSLAAKGWDVHAHNFTPNNGDAGVDELAQQLARHVDASFAPGEPLNLVGFSMGGLVARYYVQRLAADRCVRRLITIAAPHRGTYVAYLRNNVGARQMRPGSRFLRELNGGLPLQASIEFTSIWTPLDLMIVPATNALVAGAKPVMIFAPAHAFLMRDQRVLKAVEAALAKAQ